MLHDRTVLRINAADSLVGALRLARDAGRLRGKASKMTPGMLAANHLRTAADRKRAEARAWADSVHAACASIGMPVKRAEVIAAACVR